MAYCFWAYPIYGIILWPTISKNLAAIECNSFYHSAAQLAAVIALWFGIFDRGDRLMFYLLLQVGFPGQDFGRGFGVATAIGR